MALDGLVRIHTEKGNFWYGSDVPLYVDGGWRDEKAVTLEFLASDVQTGSTIFVEADELKIPLSQIKEDLEELDPSYKTARRTVVTVTEEGKEISKFREYLIEGLAERAGVVISRDKTFLIGDSDYTKDEYNNMLDALEKVLPGTNRSTLRNWLMPKNEEGHTTYAPRDWDVFEKLKEVNAKFREIHASKGKEGGFHDHYKDFVIANQVTRRIGLGGDSTRKSSRERGEDPEIEHSQSRRLGILRDKYEVLYKTKMRPVKVLGVYKFKGGEAKKAGVAEGSVNRKGIVREWHGEVLKDLGEYAEAHSIFERVLIEGIAKVLELTDFSKEELKKYGSRDVTAIMESTARVLSNVAFDRPFAKEYLESFPDMGISLGPLIENFSSSYKTGELDGIALVPTGTWKQVVEALKSLDAMMPLSWHRLGLYEYTNRGGSKDKRILRLERALERNYNVTYRARRSLSHIALGMYTSGEIDQDEVGKLYGPEGMNILREKKLEKFLLRRRDARALFARFDAPLAAYLADRNNRYVRE